MMDTPSMAETMSQSETLTVPLDPAALDALEERDRPHTVSSGEVDAQSYSDTADACGGGEGAMGSVDEETFMHAVTQLWPQWLAARGRGGLWGGSAWPGDAARPPLPARETPFSPRLPGALRGLSSQQRWGRGPSMRLQGAQCSPTCTCMSWQAGGSRRLTSPMGMRTHLARPETQPPPARARPRRSQCLPPRRVKCMRLRRRPRRPRRSREHHAASGGPRRQRQRRDPARRGTPPSTGFGGAGIIEGMEDEGLMIAEGYVGEDSAMLEGPGPLECHARLPESPGGRDEGAAVLCGGGGGVTGGGGCSLGPISQRWASAWDRGGAKENGRHIMHPQRRGSTRQTSVQSAKRVAAVLGAKHATSTKHLQSPRPPRRFGTAGAGAGGPSPPQSGAAAGHPPRGRAATRAGWTKGDVLSFLMDGGAVRATASHSAVLQSSSPVRGTRASVADTASLEMLQRRLNGGGVNTSALSMLNSNMLNSFCASLPPGPALAGSPYGQQAARSAATTPGKCTHRAGGGAHLLQEQPRAAVGGSGVLLFGERGAQRAQA